MSLDHILLGCNRYKLAPLQDILLEHTSKRCPLPYPSTPCTQMNGGLPHGTLYSPFRHDNGGITIVAGGLDGTWGWPGGVCLGEIHPRLVQGRRTSQETRGGSRVDLIIMGENENE